MSSESTSSDHAENTEKATGAEADQATAAPATQDDVKARFLAALERKHGTKGGAASGGPNGDSKIHGAHAAAGGKRNFRRKSGG